ncbi:transcription factor WRKY45-2-like [Triticum urartu]|uniref:transcription factor WRKY45-2-like n=1 Tax=Triticum urartu TaxID=4572 RepID=UPI00204498BA|nr:transcription factor WRKY45-2-like [Triticum urartu]XP_048560274.1 transcription factor WRKY45-2-like [Triticum urartu]
MKSSSTMVVNGGSEMDALLTRQQELLAQLRALILPALRDADGRSVDLAVSLFDDVIDCIAGVMSRLHGISTQADGHGPATAFDHTDVDVISPNAGEGQEEKPMISNIGQKRRRNNDRRSRSLVTAVPHYDGHHWRKYGQKNINGRENARSYYRCAYTERNCSATKTIQQQDQNGSLNCEEEAAKYNVVYYGHHTCSNHSTINGTMNDPGMDLSQNEKMAGSVKEFQKFDQGDLDVPALIEVLDNAELNWNIIC